MNRAVVKFDAYGDSGLQGWNTGLAVREIAGLPSFSRKCTALWEKGGPIYDVGRESATLVIVATIRVSSGHDKSHAAMAACAGSEHDHRRAGLLMCALSQFATQPVVVGYNGHQRNEGYRSKCVVVEEMPECPRTNREGNSSDK